MPEQPQDTPQGFDYREAIRAVGLRLFAEHGVQGVSVARLCREADVANGTFYNFYKDKSELVAEFLTEAYEGLAARLRAAEPPEGEAPSAEALHRRDVDIIVAFTEENEDLIRLAVRDEDAVRMSERSVREMLLEQRTRSINHGIEAGSYRGGVDPAVLARAESAVTTEMLLWWIADTSRMDRDTLIEALVAVRLRLTNGEV